LLILALSPGADFQTARALWRLREKATCQAAGPPATPKQIYLYRPV